MAQFIVTGPDGKKYRVTGENAEGAVAAVKKMTGGMSAASADPGYSSTDPNRTQADFWGDMQKDVIGQNPIAARASKFVQGVPFVGQWADEAIGAIFGDKAKTATRVTQEAMDAQKPGQSAALQLGGGIAGTAITLGAAGPAIVAQAPQALGAQALAGAATGAGAGALEGAVSGAGAANGGDRAAGAGKGALIGGWLGAGVGAAAPVVAAGVRNLLMSIKGSDVATIAKELGVTTEAARAVRAAMDGEDLGAAVTALQRGGPDAMLVEAGPSLQALGKGVKASGGQATRIMTDAIAERSAKQAAAIHQGIGDAFAPGTAIMPAIPKLGTAYDAAYAQAIDYSSAPGRTIEALVKRVPPSYFAKARQLIEMDPDVPEEIKRQFLISVQPDGSLKPGTLPSTLELDYVTRSLNDVAKSGDGKGALGGNTNEGRTFGKLASRIRDAMKEANPQYAQALEYASTEIGVKEARDFGASILRQNVTRDMVKEQFAGAPMVERLAAKASVRTAIDDSLANVRRTMGNPDTDVGEAIKAVKDLSSRANREKLAVILGQKEAERLSQTLDEAATAFEIQAALSRNSDTAVNQAVQGSIKQSASPGAVKMLMQGKPLDATKRLTQLFTGTTPEAQQAVEAGIYTEIAKALTEIKGPAAQRALVAVRLAMQGQAVSEKQARNWANTVSAALAGSAYQTGTQSLPSPTR